MNDKRINEINSHETESFKLHLNDELQQAQQFIDATDKSGVVSIAFYVSDISGAMVSHGFHLPIVRVTIRLRQSYHRVTARFHLSEPCWYPTISIRLTPIDHYGGDDSGTAQIPFKNPSFRLFIDLIFGFWNISLFSGQVHIHNSIEMVIVSLWNAAISSWGRYKPSNSDLNSMDSLL